MGHIKKMERLQEIALSVIEQLKALGLKSERLEEWAKGDPRRPPKGPREGLNNNIRAVERIYDACRFPDRKEYLYTLLTRLYGLRNAF